jgi:release factor glutamine methyltransferase
VRDLLLGVASKLGSATEARWVVEQALGSGGVISQAARGLSATPSEVAAVDAMVDRRLAGEPLQYVLGSWAFRSLELSVDSRVLIPRPETEVVVGHALDELGRLAEEGVSGVPGGSDGPGAADGPGGPGQDPIIAVDLGTGSGAIALSLAVEGPARVGDLQLQVWAIDLDAASLSVATANADSVSAAHPGSAPVNLRQGSWFEALPADLAGRISLVVANPPYVSEDEWAGLDPVVRDHEPRRALVAGPTGTEMIDQLLEQAPAWLAPNGALVLEIAPHQAEDSGLRAIVSGFDTVVVRRDFAERSRALIARVYESGLQ